MGSGIISIMANEYYILRKNTYWSHENNTNRTFFGKHEIILLTDITNEKDDIIIKFKIDMDVAPEMRRKGQLKNNTLNCLVPINDAIKESIKTMKFGIYPLNDNDLLLLNEMINNCVREYDELLSYT